MQEDTVSPNVHACMMWVQTCMQLGAFFCGFTQMQMNSLHLGVCGQECHVSRYQSFDCHGQLCVCLLESVYVLSLM